MKSIRALFIGIIICLTFVFNSCSDFFNFNKEFKWQTTDNDVLFWGVVKDTTYTYEWIGGNWNSFANGKGVLLTYNSDNDIIQRDSLEAYYGALRKKDVKKVSDGKYVGEFEKKKMQGFGVLVKSNEIFAGNFSNSQPNGYLDWYVGGKLRYKGNWLNGSFDGEGTLYKENNETVTGIWKNGKIHEKMMEFSNEIGDYYGYIKDGKPSRRGILKYKDGSVYDGEWKNGKYDGEGVFSCLEYTYKGNFLNNYPNGNGSILFYDYSSYVGSWKDGMANGQGVMKFSNGDVYNGEWLSNEFNGNGTYMFSTGDIYIGGFANGLQSGDGMYMGKNFSYSGGWEEGWINGFGTIEYENGEVYEGNFVENQKYGYGKYSFNSGNVYEGEFVDDKINGLGTFYFSDGSIYEGEFEDGKICGDGTFYCVINNDTVAITAFWDGKNNIPSEVSMLFSNGDLYEGPLKNGCPTQDGVWSNVKNGKVMNALENANDWYKKHKETINKVVTYTSLALTAVAIVATVVATGGTATPAIIAVVGKSAAVATTVINVADAGLTIASATIDEDYKTVGKEVGVNAAFSLVPVVGKGLGVVGKKIIKSNASRKLTSKLSESAKKIAQKKVVQTAKNGAKTVGKTIANSAIKISKTKPFKKVVTIVKDNTGKLTKKLKTTRDSALKKLSNSKLNKKLEKKIAKKIASKDAKILEKYATKHKLSKEKQELLLKEMSDNPELANLIRQNPELNIKKWIDINKPVNRKNVKKINGRYPVNSEYAGKSYYFEPCFNNNLFKNNKEIIIDGVKTKRYKIIDGGVNNNGIKTKTLLTDNDEIIVEELSNGSLRIVETKVGKGLMYYSRKYPNGVPYTKEGFPDFVKAGACKKDKNGELFVMEVPNGFTERAKDIDKATVLAKQKYGKDFDMEGYTWHHLPGPPDQLVLVDYNVHKMAKHSGGVSLKKQLNK